jgi:hypothetical protein
VSSMPEQHHQQPDFVRGDGTGSASEATTTLANSWLMYLLYQPCKSTVACLESQDMLSNFGSAHGMPHLLRVT